MFTINDEDARSAYRYRFKKDAVHGMVFKGKSVTLKDISAGGVAFKNQGFKMYDQDEVSLDLSMPNFRGNPVLTVQVRILNINPDNICNCIFENCSIDDYELVHKFVLEMQKKDLKIQKR